MGANSDLRYLLLEQDAPLEEEPQFTMDPYSGWITLNTQLDAEAIKTHEFKVEVRDNGRPALSSVVSVVVSVIDDNDNPPLFLEPSLVLRVSEDAVVGSVLSDVAVTDADEGASYRQFFIVAGNERQDFVISASGQLMVQKQLDREKQDNYALEIAVSDGLFSSQSKIEVIVTDVNDNPPVCRSPYYEHTVSEAAASGTLLMRIDAYDADLNPSLSYHISGPGSNRFTVDPSSGNLSILKRLDRERHRHYSIKVRVTDEEKPEWWCTSEVRVVLSDANDNPPEFDRTTYRVKVPENSPGARLLTRLHASDPDSGINQRVSYYLVDSSSIISSSFSRTRDGLFQLDSMTGILRVTRTLDREFQPSYNLTIEARDQGTPQLSARVSVVVTVSDVNDNPPEFPRLWYEVVVSEDVGVGDQILVVSATSKDEGQNARISYEVVDGNEQGALAVDSHTGSSVLNSSSRCGLPGARIVLEAYCSNS
ncbi:Cadherin [Trinorchestia longiramus]|nr:Cadherin [Trinorchestia longiramus]